MKLNRKELDKMLEVFSPRKIVTMFTYSKIDLYAVDLQYVIDLKNNNLKNKKEDKNGRKSNK